MSRSIICLHLGQAGVRIAGPFWNLLCIEHGIQPSGTLWYPDENWGVDYGNFYRKSNGGHYTSMSSSASEEGPRYVPQCIMADTEPTVIDEIRKSIYGDLHDPDCMISGPEDSGNNIARCKHIVHNHLMPRITQQCRRLTENSESVQGFLVVNSVGGGTGAGLSSLVIQYLSTYFPSVPCLQQVIFPNRKFSPSTVEPYNAILSFSDCIDMVDLSLLADNQSLYNMCCNKLQFDSITYFHINEILSQVMNSFCVPFYSTGTVGGSLTHLRTNLVPFPRVHFPTACYTPLLQMGMEKYEQWGVGALMTRLFEEDSRICDVDLDYGKYLSCYFHFRGDINMTEINSTINRMKTVAVLEQLEDGEFVDQQVYTNEPMRFVDWCPTGVKLSVTRRQPAYASNSCFGHSPKTITMLCNNTGVNKLWRNLLKQFDALYARRAFVHWFVGEGLEESEFMEARNDIQALSKEYDAIDDNLPFEDYESYRKSPVLKRDGRVTPGSSRSSSPYTKQKSGVKRLESRRGALSTSDEDVPRHTSTGTDDNSEEESSKKRKKKKSVVLISPDDAEPRKKVQRQATTSGSEPDLPKTPSKKRSSRSGSLSSTDSTSSKKRKRSSSNCCKSTSGSDNEEPPLVKKPSKKTTSRSESDSQSPVPMKPILKHSTTSESKKVKPTDEGRTTSATSESGTENESEKSKKPPKWNVKSKHDQGFPKLSRDSSSQQNARAQMEPKRALREPRKRQKRSRVPSTSNSESENEPKPASASESEEETKPVKAPPARKRSDARSDPTISMKKRKRPKPESSSERNTSTEGEKEEEISPVKAPPAPNTPRRRSDAGNEPTISMRKKRRPKPESSSERNTSPEGTKSETSDKLVDPISPTQENIHSATTDDDESIGAPSESDDPTKVTSSRRCRPHRKRNKEKKKPSKKADQVTKPISPIQEHIFSASTDEGESPRTSESEVPETSDKEAVESRSSSSKKEKRRKSNSEEEPKGPKYLIHYAARNRYKHKAAEDIVPKKKSIDEEKMPIHLAARKRNRSLHESDTSNNSN